MNYSWKAAGLKWKSFFCAAKKDWNGKPEQKMIREQKMRAPKNQFDNIYSITICPGSEMIISGLSL